MDVADSDLMFIDVDESTPTVKQELEEVSDPNAGQSHSTFQTSWSIVNKLDCYKNGIFGNSYVTVGKGKIPSGGQVAYLLDRLEKVPEIAKGSIRTTAGRQRARRVWDQIRQRLNNMPGSKKTSNQWMKYWTDRKKSVTCKAASGQAELTAVEEKILYLSVGGVIHKPRKDTENPKIDDTDDQFELYNDKSHYSIQDASPESSYKQEQVTMQSLDPQSQSFALSGSLITPSSGHNNYTNPKSQPHEQNRTTQFDRILQVEEKRLSMEQTNAQLMRTILEQSADRERTILDAVNRLNERLSERNEREAMMAGALKTLGDGLLALSKTIKNYK